MARIPFIGTDNGMEEINIYIPSSIKTAFAADRKMLVTECEKVWHTCFLMN